MPNRPTPDLLVLSFRLAALTLLRLFSRSYPFLPHHRGRIEYGPNDLVITGATTEIPRQVVASFLFRWVRVLLEQLLGCGR